MKGSFVFDPASRKYLPDTRSLRFSPRELEVLRLLNQGMTQIEIAIKLRISPKTVAVFVRYLREKLKARSADEIILKALQLGMLKEIESVMSGICQRKAVQ